MIGLHSQVDTRQVQEAVNREPRARQQRQRQRELADHQRLPQPLAPDTGSRSSALLQRLRRIHPRRMPRRHAAKEQSGQRRRAQRKQQHWEVQAQVRLARQRAFRHCAP